MKTENSTTFYGSITKRESLITIQNNILENSWVVEANLPYANYYGQVPQKSKPNSIFLFTKQFYTLDEILRLSMGIDNCFGNKSNLASATLEFHNKQHPAIRIKNLADYKQIYLLQNCFAEQGILFADKTQLVSEAKATITKSFLVKEIDENIYIDQIEKDKGYLVVRGRINRTNFDEIILKIKNNSNIMFFDAVYGGFLINSQTVDIVRVYSENLNLEHLKDIKYALNKEIHK